MHDKCYPWYELLSVGIAYGDESYIEHCSVSTILIRKRNAKINNTIAFSFYITKIYSSDLNIDSPVKSLLYTLKTMTLRLTLVALPRKNKFSPISIARGGRLPLITLQNVSEVIPIFKSHM